MTDKIYIVGYPHGYSALGDEQPTPIVLTRHVASSRIKNRTMVLLIDGIGSKGMSGAPVFIQRNEKLILFGMYTGLIYPDYVSNTKEKENDKFSALGVVNNLIFALNKRVKNW